MESASLPTQPLAQELIQEALQSAYRSGNTPVAWAVREYTARAVRDTTHTHTPLVPGGFPLWSSATYRTSCPASRAGQVALV